MGEQSGEESKAKKFVLPADFVTSWPLFVVARVQSFYPPEQLSYDCPGECSKETTWERTFEPTRLDGNNHGTDTAIYTVGYRCLLCRKTTLSVMYRHEVYEDRLEPYRGVRGMGVSTSDGAPPPQRRVPTLVGVMKTGQYPPPSASIPKGLQDALGPEAAKNYRRALENRNHGYGLGAASYLRRVVEDKTNELIEVAAQLAESHNVDATIVKRMRVIGSSTDYTPYEQKLEVASAVYPDSLKVGSVNPLKTLYTLVSKAIHGLSEAECVEIADSTKEVFEYIFTNLRAQVASQKAFAAKIRNFS